MTSLRPLLLSLGINYIILIVGIIYIHAQQPEPIQRIIELPPVVRLVVTGYTATATDKTATMTPPVVGRTVAVSRDLLHWLGRKVYVVGLGIRRVDDLMNTRFTGRMDILVPTQKDAYRIGNSTRQVVLLPEDM